MNKLYFCLFYITSAIFCNVAVSQQQDPGGGELIVGYYGRPNVASLGVLGKHSIEELVPIINAKVDEYDQINGDAGVIPAFHLIYGLAAGDPGRNKEYLLPLSSKVLMEYIDAAQKNGFLVFIDTQLGALTPIEAINPVLKYLKYDSVHLAIDPEFEVTDLDVPPGRVIGHITGEQINAVQSVMSGYLKDSGIKKDKILIVHRFTSSMIRDSQVVKPYDQIDLIMNLDGHGSPELKVKIYNNLYRSDNTSSAYGGFKLFFREDKPEMMTPTQVLGMESVSESKISDPPRYINYQ